MKVNYNYEHSKKSYKKGKNKLTGLFSTASIMMPKLSLLELSSNVF